MTCRNTNPNMSFSRYTDNNSINWDKDKQGGHAFNLQRPRALSGISKFTQNRIPNLNNLTQRSGLGNRRLVRNNFTAPDIKARDPVDFDRREAINVAQFGKKVQLGDTTINKLIAFEADDANDVDWLIEKARLVAIGKPNALPFGRRQRTTRKTVNFGQASLNLQERLAEIKQGIVQGIGETIASRRLLGVELARVLLNVQTTNRDVLQIIPAIEKLKLSANWREMFSHRIWSIRELKEDAGAFSTVLLYTLSNLPAKRSPDYPVVDMRGAKSAPMSISSFITVIRGAKGSGNTVYDLETRMLYNADEAIELIMSGEDAGVLDGINFKENPSIVDYLTGAFGKRKLTLRELRAKLEADGTLEEFSKPSGEEEEEKAEGVVA